MNGYGPHHIPPPPRNYEELSKKERVHQLQSGIETVLEFLHYKQEHQEDITIKELDFYQYWCFLQGQLQNTGIYMKKNI